MKIALFAVAGLASVAAAQSADVFRGPFNTANGARPAYTGGSLVGTDATLWDNGGFETQPGLSILNTAGGESVFGFGSQTTANNSVGDDFTVSGGGWNVTQLTFFGYQTGMTTSASTFTSYNWTIYAGAIGNTANPVANGSGLDSSVWTGVYRVTDTAPTGTTRPIYANSINVSVNLADGQYWVAWNAAGSLASGPWANPVAPTPAVTNGVQSIAGGAYAAVLNGTVLGAEFPFIIRGEVVPAPASLALVGLGGLVAGRRRR